MPDVLSWILGASCKLFQLFCQRQTNRTLAIAIALIIAQRTADHEDLAAKDEWKEEYDFIIIGSGSAGATLAGRLSEISNFSVLLLEAGGAETVQSDMPAMESNLKGTQLDWNFKIKSQINASLGFNNNQATHQRGKVLGGTSVVNKMNYLRGLPEDFNRWADTVGDEEWKWEMVLPYFKKAENNLDHQMVANGLHGVDGAVTFYTPSLNELYNTTQDALEEIGYPAIYDINGLQGNKGYAMLQKNIKDGKRVSMATAYLVPIYKKRKNLDILANSFAYKITFDLTSSSSIPRANGVWFLKNGVSHYVEARNEVIISAGSLNTPKLLMLSGIGPEEELMQHKIPIINTLPVGQNYIEPLGIYYGFHWTVNKSFSPPKEFNLNDYQEWFLNGTGRIAHNDFAMLRLDDTNGNKAQLRIIGGSGADDQSGEESVRDNVKRNVWQEVYSLYFGNNTISAWITNHFPYSRGQITLKSRNVYDPPIINPNFLNDTRDLDGLVSVAEEAYRIVQTNALNKFNPIPFKTKVPGCERFFTDSLTPTRDYIECTIRTFTIPISDPIATARMGKIDHVDSVVNSRLKVIGVEALRVVDSSIIPNAFSGHCNSAANMIGEKAADWIKKEWIKSN